jgi:fructose-1,6-bisphosphatase
MYKYVYVYMCARLQGDKLVFVGDLVGKGPYSAAVVRVAMQEEALCVVGNHEHLLLKWRHSPER